MMTCVLVLVGDRQYLYAVPEKLLASIGGSCVVSFVRGFACLCSSRCLAHETWGTQDVMTAHQASAIHITLLLLCACMCAVSVFGRC